MASALLEKEFDANAADLLNLLNQHGDPSWLPGAKRKLRALHLAFMQLSDKHTEATQRKLRAEALGLHWREEMGAACSFREHMEDQLGISVMQFNTIAKQAQAGGVDTALVETLQAEIATLSERLDRAPSNERVLTAIKMENEAMAAEQMSITYTVEDLNLQNQALRTELTGRIQQLQLMSKGLAVGTNPVYIKLLAGLEQNIMKTHGHDAARKARGDDGPSPVQSPPRAARAKRSAPSTPGSGAAATRAPQGPPIFRRSVTLEKGETGFGFVLQGGFDTPEAEEAGKGSPKPVMIKQIYPNQPAALSGRLFVDDCIVRVNGVNVADLNHDNIVAPFRDLNSGEKLVMLVDSTVDLGEAPPAPPQAAAVGDGTDASAAAGAGPAVVQSRSFAPQPEPVEAARMDPAAIELIRRGGAFFDGGDWASALRLFTQAMATRPTPPLAVFMRAQTFSKLGQHKEAVADCRRCLALQANDANALELLGRSLEQLGDKLGARDAFDKAQHADPSRAAVAAALDALDRDLMPGRSAAATSKPRGHVLAGLPPSSPRRSNRTSRSSLSPPASPARSVQSAWSGLAVEVSSVQDGAGADDGRFSPDKIVY